MPAPRLTFRLILCLGGAALGTSLLTAATPLAPLKPLRATASSTYGSFSADRAIDGIVSDESRWTSERSTAPSWLELELGGTHTLAGLHLFNGLTPASTLKNFTVQFWQAGAWRDIPSATIADNQSTALTVAFDDTVVVRTERLRLWITATHDGYARIKEVVVWPAAPGGMPPLGSAGAAPVPAVTVPLVYLNQSGFNLGEPKRFTAPTLPDGTRFEVRPAAGGAAVFSGSITGHIGDFSAFDPSDARDYVVSAGPHTSVPFRIGMWWLERVTYQNAINFMIDSRHHVGNWRTPCRGSFGWRDDHHFGWELHTLVAQYLSNPSAYERMPRQISYEAPKDPKLWGRLEPYRAEAPDLVKLIHWGADVLVTQQVRHEHLKAQLAYFLYAWPWLQQWLPQQNYTVVRDHTLAIWSDPTKDRDYPYDESPEHDLLALKTKIGTTKGAYPPGFSVEPNLLLYAVARREGLADAEKYFDAAHRQVAWMIAHLDWNDPLVTKGQRMSEFITLTGLTHFLREYPDRAPAGLAAKIEEWARVAVRRSANLWDFRKLDDADAWTPTGPQPTMWNEPGNVLGLPAALLVAQPFVRDPAIRTRLPQLVWSHFDDFFGRNPAGRHFCFAAPREIEGVEYGWYSRHPGGIGQLEKARFVIDGSPKNRHYPYHPEVGNIGWTEGWVQFNVAFNHSLAYLAYARTRIAIRRDGDEVVVQLHAPLNFAYDTVESATVHLTTSNGDRETLRVSEDSVNARTFSGRLKLRAGAAPQQNDGTLQSAPGATVEASYGFGYLARRATLPP